HVRGASSDPQAVERLIESNRRILEARWKDTLARRPSLLEWQSHRHRILAARDVEALDRILVLEDRVPHHDRGSGDPRIARLLDLAATLWPRARITLLATESGNADVYAPPLLRAGIEVVTESGDWDAWFASRAFHYGAVIMCRPDNFKRFAAPIARTQ